MRYAARFVTAGALAIGAIGRPSTGAGQARDPMVASAVEPDTVRVGETFQLGLWVDLPESAEVRFPAVLSLPDELEQRGAVDIRKEDDGRSWRAYYTLSAWKADSIAIPPVEATVNPEGDQAFPITLVAPEVTVASVLPADEEDLELREARGFLRIQAFPWWILLVLAALAALAWWLWRRRNAPEPLVRLGPGEMALRDFERLRGDWRAGEVTPGRFYDRYELALRRYAGATRTWSPSLSLMGLGRGAGLLAALKRSVIVRFARVRPRAGDADAALDAGEAFVRSEMPQRGEDGREAPPSADPASSEPAMSTEP